MSDEYRGAMGRRLAERRAAEIEEPEPAPLAARRPQPRRGRDPLVPTMAGATPVGYTHELPPVGGLPTLLAAVLAVLLLGGLLVVRGAPAPLTTGPTVAPTVAVTPWSPPTALPAPAAPAEAPTAPPAPSVAPTAASSYLEPAGAPPPPVQLVPPAPAAQPAIVEAPTNTPSPLMPILTPVTPPPTEAPGWAPPLASGVDPNAPTAVPLVLAPDRVPAYQGGQP